MYDAFVREKIKMKKDEYFLFFTLLIVFLCHLIVFIK